ncbi:M56 family metallopeptidase [Geitlerinema sp. PCC 9228]|uniref:M56 family metallopeptidase n=1 Tax=Geitlerinema sp. PCC 9228 TaxID=111611 RepID=UPI0008F9B39C|nr:M56 family metallopeptidase [Geitlerinema sp. PCC 9228]
MHASAIAMVLAISLAVRYGYSWQATAENRKSQTYPQRHLRALVAFLLPPLLLFMTAVSIVWMGPVGGMVWGKAGWVSYILAWEFLIFAMGQLVCLAWQTWNLQQKVHTYPQQVWEGISFRLLETPIAYSALVGCWQRSLVVSRGMLALLDRERLHAVLTHEQGHEYYRDPFWFFWLGWMRRCCSWLPHTELLWQELLLLREIRADAWASQRVDPLTLAESLLQVVQHSLPDTETTENLGTAFSCAYPDNRLLERIDALLDPTESPPEVPCRCWLWVAVSFLPLAIAPFHY